MHSKSLVRTAVFTVCVAIYPSCAGSGESAAANGSGGSGEAQVPPPQQTSSAARVLITPADTTPCISPEPDSAAASAAAIALISDPQVPLRVSSILRHQDGMLISLLPVEPHVVGGGGLVWADRDGCLMVIKLGE